MKRTLFRTRIKFCGMTRAGDVRLAGELGVDAVGFVFAAGSPRRVEPEEARAMRTALAPLVNAVAVFRDNDGESVREVVRQVRPSLLQFHGDEEDGFCRSFGVPYIKAVPMHDTGALDVIGLRLAYPAATGFLFDSHGGGSEPGAGAVFDWSLIPPGFDVPFFVAGGLTPDNVYAAALATLPWGVDASSGIESAPGIKDGDRMRRFVEEVRRSDCHELSEDRADDQG
ncbi:phosphoribosylanthranilate isomerase [Luteimonas sp. RD2P54]|uniref:N-(5'-phosphoribosyl)anthranilate isomerase n=1 Tax=Luteimonas endophytica TaxID=3042023 RepID=A0ABT6J9F0_9GAMM|nr:phosphoribosylanthranilate isomerase [Luteimonas endophytica]MDH5823450.1 phosphoribosylanthranilate isomerase [Luteimonas endophytica]